MTRTRTPLTFRTAAVPQIMDGTPRRRDTGLQQRHSLVCATCNKRFNRKFDLTRHSSLHLPKDEQRRHFCTWPSCTYSALQKTNLTTHINAVHLQKKDHKCRVENCERTFSDAASKIRHEKNLHGVLPARRIVRNQSPVNDEEATYKLEGDDSDIVMDPVRSVAQSSPTRPHIKGKREEKLPSLEQVSPYTFVPVDYFDGRSTRPSSALSCLDAPPPPPSPTPSNQTSISTVITDSSQNAADGPSSHDSRRPGEVAAHWKLLIPNTSRSRALSAPNLFVSDTAQRSSRSQSPIPFHAPPKLRVEDDITSADNRIKTMADNTSDLFLNGSKPKVRLPGIDELLRGPTATIYRYDTHELEAPRFSSPGPSTPVHRIHQRGRSITRDEDFAYQKKTVSEPLSTGGEHGSRIGNSQSPRKLNARPTNFAHFSPYGTQAERQRPAVGNRARARSEVTVLHPLKCYGTERPLSHWLSNLHGADEDNSTANSTADVYKMYPTPPRDTPPSRSSQDPLFGFLSRRPSVSTSPLDPLLSARLVGSAQPSGPKSRSSPDHSDRKMADADSVSIGGEEETEGYFVSTIITSEPLSPVEGAKCRILRSDGRILPAKLVNKRVAIPEEQTRRDHQVVSMR